MRTFSLTTVITATVKNEINTPETIVIIIEVYLGRSPNIVNLLLPTLDPILSPKKAIIPPITINMRTITTPSIYNPFNNKSSCQCFLNFTNQKLYELNKNLQIMQ